MATRTAPPPTTYSDSAGRIGWLIALVPHALRLLVVLLVGVAFGLTHSGRGWMAIALGWLLLTTLWISAKQAGLKSLVRLLGVCVLVAALVGAVFTAPGVRPKSTGKTAVQSSMVAGLVSGCPAVWPRPVLWGQCVFDHAAAKAKHLSPTTTTTPRRKT